MEDTNTTASNSNEQQLLDQSEPKKSKPKTNSFLGCFGISRNPPSFSEKKPTKNDIDPERKKPKRRSRNWLSCFKSSASTRTVPLDPVLSTDHSNRTSNASRSKGQKQVSNRDTPRRTPGRVSFDRAPKERTGETWYRSEQDIILENGKPLDDHHVDTPRDSTCPKRSSFCRKIDAIRTGASKPGSPEIKTKTIQTVSISRSTSFPSPKPAHEASPSIANTPARSRAATMKKPTGENGRPIGKKFDPLVGMSVIVLTMMIMLLWGKLCAILCTSAWFYFVSRLQTEDITKADLISVEPKFDSEEYKKRVILEGLLERNRRSIS